MTAGLVLAAGEGKRFGGPKAPFVYEGERLVDRSVRVLREGGCDPIVVVLGAWLGEVPSAEVVVNGDWTSGMGSSLRVGLAALPDDIDAALVTLVDLPGLTGAAISALIDGADAETLAAAQFAGKRANPVVLGRNHWAGVAESAVGDQGARSYLADRDVRLVPLDELADGDDLDLRPTSDDTP
jgi:CTP:molybdopterin cytidylyltransferase MocA